MKKFIIIPAIIAFVFLIESASAQRALQVKPICNGLATYLPKPEVPQSVINANGKGMFGVVNVQVLIDEKGNVEKAQTVSGHPIMRPFAEKAAREAKFRVTSDAGKPIKVSCALVYNFASYNPRNSEENIQKETDLIITLGNLNEKALVLQMPNYPTADAEVSGTVNVETKIDLEKGEVVSAKAISGHPLLRMQAEKAALQTKFPPTLTEFPEVFGQGFLNYKIEDFNVKTIENKTPRNFLIIEKGVVNNLAKSLPKPNFPNARNLNATGIVEVKVVIDMNGKVLLAKAVSGHPLLRQPATLAAREAKFGSVIIDGGEPIYVKASLLYKFKSDHTVETDLTDKDLRSESQEKIYPIISCGQCGSEPVFLAKPEYPKSAIYVKATGAVGVEIIIDENGNVESAQAVSGHPLLRATSEKAALNSKFTPKTLSGSPVKVRGYIVYSFVQ